MLARRHHEPAVSASCLQVPAGLQCRTPNTDQIRMLHNPLLIPPSAAFWSTTARALLEHGALRSNERHVPDFSGVRVLVPHSSHTHLLRKALAAELPSAFIPPRITTLSSWMTHLPPMPDAANVTSDSERLMSLYAQLRQHAWLKKLFSARRNTDLLPLAQTLLTLFDELTLALAPSIHDSPDSADECWEMALQQLSAPARDLLSDEAQLVWSLWKSQLDVNDPVAVRFARMMRLAVGADESLIWIGAAEPDPMESAFLAAYGERREVLTVRPDWRADAVDPLYAAAWPELLDEGGGALVQSAIAAPAGVSLCPAGSLEEEAQRGAQTVIRWLQQSKSCVAIIAQDRVVARRIRALLERAEVYVSDETGWKLSTTRTASAIAALLDVVATRAETGTLLDLLKSPFLFADLADKPDRVMAIEAALRRANVLGGWEAALAVLEDNPLAHDSLRRIADQARFLVGRKTLREWVDATSHALHSLGMYAALAADAAGAQVVALLDALEQDCDATQDDFSFSEWRAFISLQLEATPYVPDDIDHRVVMLQLNGARLRRFDAVLMVGADASHLPSQLNETLFFANAVRRQLGLPTREMRQRMQMRDFAELLTVNPEVVLSWQAVKDGEPNPVSSWVERLQLVLERAGTAAMPFHEVRIASSRLRSLPVRMPSPSAPHLLPARLSASGYNSLVACPYQFFATRMLGLNRMDELSDMPEKRDYGDWLHKILTLYHEAVRDTKVPKSARFELLQDISQQVFDAALARSAAALGYYARWQKVMPAYLEWANQREADGWQFVAGEQWFEKSLHWDEGKITLHGRIDRIDHNEAGERAVLDYKTKNVQALRDKLKEGEDHQLAFYGMLSDVPPAYGHYVALEATKDKTGAAEAQQYLEWQRALEERLVGALRAIAAGSPLHPNGINRVCEYCEVRGLCRKGAW